MSINNSYFSDDGQLREFTEAEWDAKFPEFAEFDGDLCISLFPYWDDDNEFENHCAAIMLYIGYAKEWGRFTKQWRKQRSYTKHVALFALIGIGN